MRIKLLFAFLIFASVCHAQQTAITDTGEQVILYEDGSWKYSNKSGKKSDLIKTNNKVFKKNDRASFLLKSTKWNVGFWLNPKKWKFEKAVKNSAAEYEFELKGKDLYGMVISEKVEIPLKSLKEIALENGKSVAPDLRIVKQEYRIVNGQKILLLRMDGTTRGIKASYYGYYFSNSNGTVQFLTYSSPNLINSNIKDVEELLNGLVAIE